MNSKIVYRSIFFFGILSVLGGLNSGVIFMGGIIIALIFGYLGWIKKDAKNDNSKESLKNDELTYPPISISFETQIEKFKIQKELISKAFEENLLTFEEYKDKLSKININLDLIHLEDSHLKRVKKLELENHGLFEALSDLLENELITLDEYKSKKEIIINKLLLNNTNSNVDSQYIESLKHKEETERETITGVFILLIMALVLIFTLYYLIG